MVWCIIYACGIQRRLNGHIVLLSVTIFVVIQYLLEFLMLRFVCELQEALFDVSALIWKGNRRPPNPHCCSHLCPLMIWLRLSRPNYGCLCHKILTHSSTHEEMFFLTFYCGECLTKTSPAAFVGLSSDALLLQRWMDGCRARGKVVLSSRHHSPLWLTPLPLDD